MQNTNKFLKIAVLLLLAANIALVAFMVWGKPEKNRKIGRQDPTEMLAKELGLSDEQKVTHRQMKEEHMKSIKGLMDSIRDVKVSFYTLNKQAQLNDSLLNVYGGQISALQIKADKAMLAHFKRVRAFLKPEQQLKYDTLVIKMINRGRKDSAAKNK
jgi:hypothetical protein